MRKLAVLFALLLCPLTAHAWDIRYSMEPSLFQVQAGETFEVTLLLTQTDYAYNGFSFVVGYDTALLEYVSRTIGSTIPAAAAACPTGGNYFQSFRVDSSRVAGSMILLCMNTLLTGPAEMQRITFRAKASGSSALVYIPYACCWGNSDAYVDRSWLLDAGQSGTAGWATTLTGASVICGGGSGGDGQIEQSTPAKPSTWGRIKALYR